MFFYRTPKVKSGCVIAANLHIHTHIQISKYQLVLPGICISFVSFISFYKQL